MAIARTDIPASVCAVASDLHAAASPRNQAFVVRDMQKRKRRYMLDGRLARNTLNKGSCHEQELTLLVVHQKKGVQYDQSRTHS